MRLLKDILESDQPLLSPLLKTKLMEILELSVLGEHSALIS